jgi:hypothetical protein
MEQRLFIRIGHVDAPQCMQIHVKLFELYGRDALSYSEVCYWNRQFIMGREYVEDARRDVRPPDVGIQLCFQKALEEMPLASV